MTPQAGTVVDAGGERVHVVETGPPGGPPLLLSSGLGGAWFDWRPSADLLDGAHRVTVFDRPGLGLSPAGRAAPSLRRETAILAGLAERAGGRVVVVAHSLAGFHAEAFARQWPDLVRGLVLVDPSYERDPSGGAWRPRFSRVATHPAAPRVQAPPRVSAAAVPATRALGAVVGATRIPWLAAPAGRRLAMRFLTRRRVPVPDGEVRAVYGRGTVLGGILAEELAYREMAADLAALRVRLPFPPVPLVVLTALGDVKDPAKAREWAEGHRTLAEMSPYGRQVKLPTELHLLHVDRPDVVAEAVAEVLGRGEAGEEG
ncbi:alpha/beta fold hydrolase [Spirillospora sp. NBC_01491]|uniref:alpha/beta fold hydrolase n=1 Tax=Spirillospora sp. NBC_01491 TaxID=2976007 RepID=UPI002E310C2F|nr:alpha/beta hydrolase [Spirillospora sp. NBC_01491]